MAASEPNAALLSAFRALAEVSAQYADWQSGAVGAARSRQLDASGQTIQAEFAAALATFEEALREEWFPGDDGKARSAIGVPDTRMLAAQNAQVLYRKGRLSRAKLVATWDAVLSVATSPQNRDEARFKAATAFLKKTARDNQRDFDAARTRLEQLAASERVITTWRILGVENLVSLPGNDSERMKERSTFLQWLDQQRSFEWLVENVLQKVDGESCEECVARIAGVLVTLRTVRASTAINMVADAERTRQRAQSLEWIAKTHADNEAVDDALHRGRTPQSSGSRWRVPLAVACAIGIGAGIWFLEVLTL